MLKLTLDASGVNALFPEGTEARVLLSQAVVAEVVKKTVPKYIDDTVNKAIKDAFNGSTGEHMSALNDGVNQGIQEYVHSRYNGLKFTDRAKSEISDEVKKLSESEIERLITRSVQKHYEEKMISLRDRIDSAIDKRFYVLSDGDLNHWIEQRAKVLIEKAMKS
ncbi:MAG: hypothetical protein ACRCT7_11895 [Shewanella sp.]